MKNSFFILTLFSILFCSSSFAQKKSSKKKEVILEMIQNGSFEDLQSTPKKLGQITALHWNSPTGKQADLFSETANSESPVYVPYTSFGKQKAVFGDNFAGVVGFSLNNRIPRTYLSTPLLKGLKKGTKYCVSYHVSLAEKARYATNSMQLLLHSKAIYTELKVSIEPKGSLIALDSSQLLDWKGGWERIAQVYTAKGGEKYVTIGNFSDAYKVVKKSFTKETAHSESFVPYAYYFIDNVSVLLMTKESTCDVKRTDRTKEQVSGIRIK